MPPRRKLTAVPDIPPEPERLRAPDLRDAVRAAVDAMTWLGPTDEAMRTLALRQAEEIEKAVDRAEELERLSKELGDDESAYRRLQKLTAMCEVTKTVGWLGPQLQGVLRDLGGTPKARAEFGKDKPIGGRLAELRADAQGEDDS